MKSKIVLILLFMNSSYVLSYHQGIETYQFIMQCIHNLINTIDQSSNQVQLDDKLLVFKDYKAMAGNASLECFNICTESLPQAYTQIVSGSMPTGSEKKEGIFRICTAVYALLKNFGQIFSDKQQFHMQVMSFSYQDLVSGYPHLALVDMYIKAMNLLVHLTLYGSLPEKIFANIHLVSMILPGIYEKPTKKWSRKLFKKHFDLTGRLTNVVVKLSDHPYKKFFKKIAVNWYDLLTHADKFPKNLSPFIPSEFKELVINPYNQTLLHIIECGMNKTFNLLPHIYENQQNIFIQELYSLYNLIQ